MNVPPGTQLDSAAAALKGGAAKLAELLKQSAALRAELETAATDAEAGGLANFADVFRELARTLGPLGDQNGKPTTLAGKRRGRPPKPIDDPPTT